MANPAEVAEVIVNGRTYRNWQTVVVTRTFGEFASTFAFTAASPVESSKGWAAQKLKVGDDCEIRLGGAKVIDGKVNVRQVAFDAQQHGLSIQGLSLTANAIYSSVPADKAQYKGYSLPQIANGLLKPLGVSLKLQGDTKGVDKPFRKVNAAVGESVFSLVERLCRMRNVHLTDDRDGNLVAYRKAAGEGSAATLTEGKNIKSARVVMQDENVFSKIQATGSMPGDDKRNGDAARATSASATNSQATSSRMLVFVAEEPGDSEDMQMRADREVAENLATLVQCSVVVQGWFKGDGTLWIDDIGKNVTVQSPILFPDDEMELAIQSVTHRQDDGEGGTETQLELVTPGRLGGNQGVTTDQDAVPGSGTKSAEPETIDT